VAHVSYYAGNSCDNLIDSLRSGRNNNRPLDMVALVTADAEEDDERCLATAKWGVVNTTLVYSMRAGMTARPFVGPRGIDTKQFWLYRIRNNRKEGYRMEKTWKPTAAGILTIIAGFLGLLIGLALAVGLGIMGSLAWVIPGFPGVASFLALLPVPGIILSIVAIIGGIYAIRRRVWGLALAGAICALLFTVPFLGWILAILAIIFVSLGKREFS